jgi:hypothetical protein
VLLVGRAAWWKRSIVGLYVILTAVTLAGASGFLNGWLVTNFAQGDSLSHRSGALQAVPALLRQPIGAVLLGNGYYSGPSLFRRGLLQTGSFYAIDNQFVSTLVEVGVIGVLVVVLTIVLALQRRRPESVPLMIMVAFFFTFDEFAWPMSIALFGMLIGAISSSTTEQNQEPASPARTAAMARAR